MKDRERWETAPELERTHAIRGCRWVKVVARIRDNFTGEVRNYQTNESLNDGEAFPSVFNWSDNNYSCDCNRALFFGYAAGKTHEETERPCGNGRYAVQLQNPVTGYIYYDEFWRSTPSKPEDQP